MLCEVNDRQSFYVEDALTLEGKYGDGVPVLCTGSYRLARQASDYLWNAHNFHTVQYCQHCENCPYVLVLYASKRGQAKGKPSAASVALARSVCRALAIGIESHYLYNLD